MRFPGFTLASGGHRTHTHLGACEHRAGPAITAQGSALGCSESCSCGSCSKGPGGWRAGSCAALPSRVALIFAEGPMGWWAGAAWAGLIAATLHSS